MKKRINNKQKIASFNVKKTYLSALLALSVGALSGCGGSADSRSDEGSLIEDATGTLVINEVVSEGSGEDWIELYVTQGSVNLSDYSLLDDNTDHDMQSLPDVTLSAGEYVVINAIDEDNAASQAGYYVTFKLGSSDSVNLFKGIELVDQMSWDSDDVFAGFSYGRYADGEDSWEVLTPTPGSVNELLERGPLVINEVMAKSAEGDDWIKFYNSGNVSITLSDYQIVDGTDDLEAVTLPNISLAAGEYYILYASEGNKYMN